MEEIIDKKIDGLKIYMKGEMDHYLNLQREGFRDDLRAMVENRLEKMGNRLDSHDQMLHRHSKEIQLLKVA